MPDLALRELERQAACGDPEAVAQLERLSVRTRRCLHVAVSMYDAMHKDTQLRVACELCREDLGPDSQTCPDCGGRGMVCEKHGDPWMELEGCWNLEARRENLLVQEGRLPGVQPPICLPTTCGRCKGSRLVGHKPEEWPW